jgi:glycosyltransferase involved in cell wall biosynthesis
MFPFVLAGKILGRIYALDEEFDVFFFFPGYAIGGAERVNSEIIKTVEDKRVIIFFTKKSPNEGMKHFFERPNVVCREISRWTDDKWQYWNSFIYRGICSHYINRQKKTPAVFIGQCNFGYKLLPHLSREIRVSELIHMYDPKFTWVWAPFIRYIDTRVIVGEIFRQKFADCYRRAGIPEKYLHRLKIIFYRLEYVPERFHERNFELPLKVYYAGRGGPQKRVWIIVDIILKCRALRLPVEFKLAGPFREELPEDLLSDGTYVGELQGGQDMYRFHRSNDILLMTSAWEGFPLVIMEAMAFGAIPMVSNIDAIPEHIRHGENGFLLQATENEELLAVEAVENLKSITGSRLELKRMSDAAFQYANTHFGAVGFRSKYREILGFLQ